MYGDPTTTPGGKALKFYCSVRCRVSSGASGNIKIKQGLEEVVIGKLIKITCVKNKIAAPYRKAEFEIYFDGREMNKSDEIAAVAINQGLIPKYDSQGNMSPTGRTYMIEAIDEETGEVQKLVAKKKDDVAPELRKYPAIQKHLLDIINGTIKVDESIKQVEMDSDMSDEEFEQRLLSGELDSIDEDTAEETSWSDM